MAFGKYQLKNLVESLQHLVLAEITGIKIGPAYFSLCVSKSLRSCLEFGINYFDDIIIFSKTIEDHIEHIRLVMEALKRSGFTIGANKCIWFAKEVKLLGFIVSGNKAKMDPDKVAAIRERKSPTNIKQVQQCLGLFNFFRRFIDKEV